MQVPTDGHPQARWGWGGEAAGEGGSNPGHWALGSSLPPSPGPPPPPIPYCLPACSMAVRIPLGTLITPCTICWPRSSSAAAAMPSTALPKPTR